MTLENRRERLTEWIGCIENNVAEAIVNQHIYWEVQTIIRDNPQLQSVSSAFYVWMDSTFVHSTALAIRRQLDKDRNSISIRRFLEELRSRPELISRDYHRSLYSRPEYNREHADYLANYTYDRHVGAGASVLDATTIEQELSALLDRSQVLHHYADRVVAHYDARGLTQPRPKFNDLENCLGLLEKLVLRYMLLLKGVSQESLLPTFLYDWKSVFRVKWLP